MNQPLNGLFGQPLAVLNVGLPSFADDLRRQGTLVVHIDWRPPAGGNQKVAALLDRIRRSQAVFRKH